MAYYDTCEKSGFGCFPETLEDGTNLKALAKAVAHQETQSCTKGTGKSLNNCFGIRNGNTAPCPKISSSNFCIYEKKEDSYQAFYKIWTTWYKTFPNLEKAERWSKDGSIWLKNVTAFYEQYNAI